MAEPLEDRRLLAITVDTLIDEADGSITDGDISLRDAIAAAPAGETIDFAAPLDGGTILLTRGQLTIRRPLRIDASSLAGGLTLTGTVLIGNSAKRGGSVDNLGLGTITNRSFSGNSADRGGGIRNTNSPFTTGILEVTNSILWGDHATSGPNEIRRENGSVTVNDSLIEGGWSGTGGNNVDVNLQFVDADGMDDVPNTLDDDLRLAPTSPAIDAGSNLAPGLEDVTTDRDGLARFIDDPDTADTGSGAAPIIDLGAYEVRLPVPPLEFILIEINQLEEDGTLNRRQAKSLRKRVEQAVKKLDKGQPRPAIHKLRTFVFRTETLVWRGKLTAEQGQPLIDAAREEIASIREEYDLPKRHHHHHHHSAPRSHRGGRDKVFTEPFNKRSSLTELQLLDEPQLPEERQSPEKFNATWDEALLSVFEADK